MACLFSWCLEHVLIFCTLCPQFLFLPPNLVSLFANSANAIFWKARNSRIQQNFLTKMQQNFLTQMQWIFPTNMKQNFWTMKKAYWFFGPVEILSLHSLLESIFLNMFDCDLYLSSPCPPFLIPYVLLFIICQLCGALHSFLVDSFPELSAKSLFPVYCWPSTLTRSTMSSFPLNLSKARFLGQRHVLWREASLLPDCFINSNVINST